MFLSENFILRLKFDWAMMYYDVSVLLQHVKQVFSFLPPPPELNVINWRSCFKKLVFPLAFTVLLSPPYTTIKC